MDDWEEMEEVEICSRVGNVCDDAETRERDRQVDGQVDGQVDRQQWPKRRKGRQNKHSINRT